MKKSEKAYRSPDTGKLAPMAKGTVGGVRLAPTAGASGMRSRFTAVVVGFEDDKRIGTVVYQVRVTYLAEGQKDQQTWQVAKRFSEFTDFAKNLPKVGGAGSLAGANAKVPKISTSVIYGLMTSPQHRQPELDKFLQEVLQHDLYRESVQQFLRKGADSNSEAAIKVR
jgi:hypothetical protein